MLDIDDGNIQQLKLGTEPNVNWRQKGFNSFQLMNIPAKIEENLSVRSETSLGFTATTCFSSRTSIRGD